MNKKSLVVKVLTLVFALIFFFRTSTTVNANILNMPKLSIVSDGGVSIGSEYSFVPKVTDETKVQTFGSSLWKNTKWSSRDNRAFKSIDVSPTSRDNLKNKIGVRYTNVGNYNNQKIDLKITINNWSRYGNSGRAGVAGKIGNISFENKRIALSTQGYNWVDTTWEYVKSGTNTKVPVSGYFTFSDIDIRQGVQFSKTTSQNIDRFIVANRKNKLQYKNQNGEYKIYDTVDTDMPDGKYNDNFAFTFIYSDLGSFRFKWITDWGKTIRNGRGFTPDRYYYTDVVNAATGEYFFYVLDKPARTSIPKPTKKVNYTSNYDISKPLKYTITHEVPQEDPRYYYNKYIIEDTIDTVLINPKVKVTNQVNEDVSKKFNVSISGSKLTVTAKSSTLSSEDFYGEKYNIEIESSVDRKKIEEKVRDKSEYVIKNKATIKAHNYTFSTNEVQTKIPKRTLTVNHIDNDTKEIIESETLVMFDGEKYSYSPKTDLLFKNKYKYFPVNSTKQEGVMSGSNVKLDFFYSKPRAEIGFNKIRIKTDKAESGLPLYLNFNLEKITEKWAESQVDLIITNIDKNKQIFKSTKKLADLENGIEIKIPSEFLEKDTVSNYEATLVSSDNKLVILKPNQDKIDTDGYVSSEKIISLESKANEQTVDYEGVAMTERVVGQTMTLYFENVSTVLKETTETKSGYGFESGQKITYTNELNELMSVNAKVEVDSEIAEGDYPINNGMKQIEMIKNETVNDEKVVSVFEFPKVSIEKGTGKVLLDTTTSNARDGGNKLYIPIWIDELGDYSYTFKTDPIGHNQIRLKFINTVRVNAYMYGHINSETIDKDEILIEPVNIRNPFPEGLPEGWTEDDVDWLQK